MPEAKIERVYNCQSYDGGRCCTCIVEPCPLPRRKKLHPEKGCSNWDNGNSSSDYLALGAATGRNNESTDATAADFEHRQAADIRRQYNEQV
jgi:hypothetical protein